MITILFIDNCNDGDNYNDNNNNDNNNDKNINNYNNNNNILLFNIRFVGIEFHYFFTHDIPI